MRVLYIGSTQSIACATFYAQAMERLGFSVTRFDPQYFAAANLVEKLQIRFRKGPSHRKVKSVSDAILSLCRKEPFDAVFVMAENFLDLETIDEIRGFRSTKPIFLYHSHDNNFSKGICKPKRFFETLAAYDFAFTTKSQNVSRYREVGQKNAYFIPSAFEPSVHCPVATGASHFGGREFDVTFVGTYDRSRDKFLAAVGWNSLHVWGNGWKRSPDYRKYLERITPQAIYNFQFADVVSHSRCSLGLLREEAEDLHTQRTFEIPACGSLQLAPRNEEILSFFEEDKEIVCFSSLEELNEKAQYYLKHEEERKRIARQGYERCYRDRHTYLDRVADMFQIAARESGRAFLEGLHHSGKV